MKSAARGPLSSVVMLGHRVHTAVARRAPAAGYRTFCVHDLRLTVVGDASYCHQLLDFQTRFLRSVCSDLTLVFNNTATARPSLYCSSRLAAAVQGARAGGVGSRGY